jgi:hypothetical protein
MTSLIFRPFSCPFSIFQENTSEPIKSIELIDIDNWSAGIILRLTHFLNEWQKVHRKVPT